MTRKYQTVHLNQRYKKVVVTEGPKGESFVLLEHIRDAFHYADELTLQGEPVPFLQDDQGARLFPRRIAFYPGETLTVVPLSNKNLRQDMTPAPLPSHGVSMGKSLSNSSALSEESLEEKLQDILEVHHNRLDQSQLHHTDALLEHIGTVQSQVANLQRDLDKAHRKISDQVQELAELQRQSLEHQQRSANLQQLTFDRLVLIHSKIQAVLTQTFELHEYPSPRLFIVLPEVPSLVTSTTAMFSGLATTKFRLYFLCECGAHTSPVGSRRQNQIHIARHEGYEIKRPSEFFQKFGPYVLRMLQMLKYGISIASVVMPALSLIHSMDLPEALAGTLNEKVATSIHLLSAYHDSVDGNLTGILGEDNGDCDGAIEDDQGQDAADDTWQDLEHIEGADLRRLSSYLNKKDNDRAFGNLFRTVDEAGHVRWICLDHYRSTYHQKQDRQFENEILLNRGVYDHQLGKVSVTLSSSSASEAFMAAMSQARAFNELDLHLRNITYQDLSNLGVALMKTNVSKLTLTCHQYREYPLLGKRRIQAILKIMNAGKIRAFHFKEFKDLFSAKAVVPAAMLSVRSLELTNMSLKAGHETLARIIVACRSLVEIRFTSVPLPPQGLDSVLKALKGCTALRALSLNGCKMHRLYAPVIAATLKSLSSLRELDLGFNMLGDDGVCQIIEAVGGQLERLSLPYTGFGDESAMALEREVDPKRLKCLDISNTTQELESASIESILRLASQVRWVELVLPETKHLSDESCARIVRGLNARRLERFELEGCHCGDRTAQALATMLIGVDNVRPPLAIFTVDLPRITLSGAKVLGEALGDCRIAKVSFGHSSFLRKDVADELLLASVLTNMSTHLTKLDLQHTQLTDDGAATLCRVLQETQPLSRLEHLDLCKNELTAGGGTMVLESLETHPTLKVLRMESESYKVLGSLGPAVRHFLETNRVLFRLTVSHVGLGDLTAGLGANKNTLKCIEITYLTGSIDDTILFGDFLQSRSNTLQRLIVKHAHVCDDDASLEHLAQCLKPNKTIVDLEWFFDVGIQMDSYILQHYIRRNRDLWRANAESNVEDLVLTGMKHWTMRAVAHKLD